MTHSPTAAAAHLQPGDGFTLTAGATTCTGTVIGVHANRVLTFADHATGRTLLADLDHWDTISILAPARCPR